MNKDYIKVGKTMQFPNSTNLLKKLDDSFWKNSIFHHLLLFYKNYNQNELKQIILVEDKKANSRKEREIAKYIRKYLKNNRLFNTQGFKIPGEVTNDEDVEGNYDILILHSFWSSEFPLECKNLDNSADLIKKYVFYKRTPQENDGGVYRYFNGKYAQNQNFGGMIGFVLKGDVQKIKTKICKKLADKFDTNPDGDLIKPIIDNAIEENDFTFDSVHSRFGDEFTIHHLLFHFDIY